MDDLRGGVRGLGVRAVAIILGVLWVWNGLAYHLAFFARINPAACGFAALFVLQAVLFFGYGAVAGRLRFAGQIDWRSVLDLFLIAYAALIYAVVGYDFGHAWPNARVFGVAPCPTTILTFGVLMLAAGPLPLWLVALPVAWAGISGTAAVLLNVPEDVGLLVFGVLGAILLPPWGMPRRHCAPRLIVMGFVANRTWPNRRMGTWARLSWRTADA